MPYGDETGPLGQEPLTGRGLGPCGRGLRRGCYGGFGRGYGYGRFGYAGYPLTEDDEKDLLESDLKAIEAEKKAIEKRLDEIAKTKKK
jgi:hypothetical protein